LIQGINEFYGLDRLFFIVRIPATYNKNKMRNNKININIINVNINNNNLYYMIIRNGAA